VKSPKHAQIHLQVFLRLQKQQSLQPEMDLQFAFGKFLGFDLIELLF
jgi:hypothetical protein